MRIIIGNIFSLLASLVDSYSGTKKSKKEMMLWQLVSQFFYAGCNFTLNAYSGLTQNIVTVFRNYFASKEKVPKVIEVVLVLSALILGIVFNNLGIIGLLPVIANFQYSVALFKFSNNFKVIKISFIIVQVCFVVYNAIIYNFVGAIFAAIILVTTLVSLITTSK